jgi:hypothetical protein
MPPSELRQVWLLRRSRTPHISSSKACSRVCEGSSLAAFPVPPGNSIVISSQRIPDNKIAFRRHALALRAADERQPSRPVWY